MRIFPWNEVVQVLETVSKIDVENYLAEYGEGADRFEIRVFMNSFYKDGWYLDEIYPDPPASFPEWFIGTMKYIKCLNEQGEPLEMLNHAYAFEIGINLYKGKKFIKYNQITLITSNGCKEGSFMQR